MPRKLRVGIVGCGGATQQMHIPELLKLKDKVILQALCDKNEALAKEIAAKYHVPNAYPELSDMLVAEDLDIVDVCTPPQVHAPIAVEALEYGCHVMIEKPMALKTFDCDEIINAEKKAGKKLCVIHNQLFTSPFRKARKLVADGAIGEFIGMRLFHSDPREAMIMRQDPWLHKLPGGLIGETAPHPVYMSLAFLNKAKSVDIYAKNFLEHPWAPFDEFRIELEGEKAMSSITISYSSNRGEIYIDILGTEGVIYLDLGSMLLVHYGKKVSSRPIPFARHFLDVSSQLLGGIITNAFKMATKGLGSGHDIIIEQFVDSILNNQRPPVSGEEGRETVRAVEMIVKRLKQKYGTP